MIASVVAVLDSIVEWAWYAAFASRLAAVVVVAAAYTRVVLVEVDRIHDAGDRTVDMRVDTDQGSCTSILHPSWGPSPLSDESARRGGQQQLPLPKQLELATIEWDDHVHPSPAKRNLRPRQERPF